MTTSHTLYEVVDGVGVITLNRPETLNAFSDTMRRELPERLQQLQADPAARAIVITGAGRAFCAGGDVRSMAELQDHNDTAVIRHRVALGAHIVRLIRVIPKPVIAAVNGAAAGAGMNLALACDFRYASERARFVESFIRIGLVPDWGGHFLLTQLIGTARAMEVLMTGDVIDAQEAFRLGIVNRVLPNETFRDDVLTLARRLAEGPRAAIAAVKRGVHLAATGGLDDVLAWENETQATLFLSPDAREGMRAFLERRKPGFGR